MAKAHLYFTSYVWAYHEIGAHAAMGNGTMMKAAQAPAKAM
jgi:hypothetical protein